MKSNRSSENSTQKSYKFPLKVKILLALGSLVFFFVLLEVGLWLTGVLLFGFKEKPQPLAKRRGADVKILCVGDSFTFGGEVERDETYPAYLQKELDALETPVQYLVYNGGVCESNTQELCQNLQKWLPSYKPDVVILLAGSANRFNPWEYERYTKKDTTSFLKSSLLNLRVFKMLRIIFLNMKVEEANRISASPELADIMDAVIEPRGQPNRSGDHFHYIDKWRHIRDTQPGKYVHNLWALHNAGKSDEAIQKAQSGLDKSPENALDIYLALAHFYFTQGDYHKAEQILVLAREKGIDVKTINNALTFYYRQFAKDFTQKMQFGAAIECYLKSIQLDPHEYHHYYAISKIYDLQSIYDSNMIYSVLKRVLDANPYLAESKKFMGHLKVYENKQVWELGVEKWTMDNLAQCVEMCRNRNVRIIFQNYPISYALANKALEKIAGKYQLPLVDNLSVFEKKAPKSEYFYDDDHCTPKGHQLMVENILNTLTAEKVVNSDDRSS